ncbi:MAG: phenylalanine--tRNA ligase subunit alpha, partial [Acidobacteriaceae bacterium]
MAATDILADLIDQALAEMRAAGDLAVLDEIRVRLLGKKGLLTEQLKSLGRLPAGERPAAGQKINEAKAAIQG